MKVKIKDKFYRMEIIPRELTAVLFTKDEPMKNDDYEFMLFHCPCPSSKKKLEEIKAKAIKKAEDNFEEFEHYLECNKTLHKGDKENENV